MSAGRHSFFEELKMKPSLTLLALLACLLAFQTGCGAARKSEPIFGPLKIESEEASLGERLFMWHCNQCHPGGEAGLAPALNNKPAPGFAMQFQVRNGMGAMPRFSTDQVSGGELDAIVSYLVVLRNR